MKNQGRKLIFCIEKILLPKLRNINTLASNAQLLVKVK